jgi:hypothetical protein
MRVLFDPQGQCPPVGGGSTVVRFFAGEGAPIDEVNCETPLLWIRLSSRFRSTVFPEASVELPLDDAGLQAARQRLATLTDAAVAEVRAQGVPADRIRPVQRLLLRYQGTDTALPVAVQTDSGIASLLAGFEAGYRQRFAFLMPGRALVIEAVSVEAIGAAEPMADSVAAVTTTVGDATPLATVRMHCAPDDGSADAWRDAALHQREALPPGARVVGPAVIAEANATTVVEPGWAATTTARGDLLLQRVQPRQQRHAAGTQAVVQVRAALRAGLGMAFHAVAGRPGQVAAEGDLVAFRSAGAYGAVMASEYNSRPLIPEGLVKGDQFAVIRARPTYEEMISRDTLPPWL